MMNRIMKESVVFAVVLLFFGVAVAPGTNGAIGQETPEEEYVEYTTEVCGLSGLKPQTIRFTKQQADEVEQLFDSIKSRLNNATSKEEAVVIFKEAVVEIDKYELLGRLSLRWVQRLVTGGYDNPRLEESFGKTSTGLRVKRNFCCLLAGNTDNTIFNGFLSNLFLVLSFLFIGSDIFVLLWMTSYYFTNLFPISLGQTISLGVQGTQWTYPANGWVYTIGIIGVRQWAGDIIGDLRQGVLDDLIGITGFIGIKIYDNTANDVFYMGFACRVKINELKM